MAFKVRTFLKGLLWGACLGVLAPLAVVLCLVLPVYLLGHLGVSSVQVWAVCQVDGRARWVQVWVPSPQQGWASLGCPRPSRAGLVPSQAGSAPGRWRGMVAGAVLELAVPKHKEALEGGQAG